MTPAIDGEDVEVNAMFEAVVSRAVSGYVLIVIDDGHGFKAKFRKGARFGNVERGLHALLGGVKALVSAWEQGVPITDMKTRRDR